MGISIQNLILMDHDTTLQVLDQCMQGYQTRKGGNEVTFTTEMKLDNASVLRGGMQMEKMAFIIWLDRNKAQQMLNQKTPAGMNDDHAGPLRSLMLALQEVQAVGAGNSSKQLPSGKYLNPLLDDLLKLFGGQG